MDKIWNSVLDFFVTASADLVLKIVVAALMVIIGLKLITWLAKLLEKAMDKSKLDPGIKGFLTNTAALFLRFMLVISVLIYLGVPAASFLAILTSAGLAIGLALQGSLSNFAGGLMILFFKPFRVGDFIKTETADGNVQDISIMYTTLRTLDGKKVVIPNAKLSNDVITDFSWYDTRRIDLSITTDFYEDVEKIRNLLLSAAQRNEQVLDDPAPGATLDKIQDGTLVFTLRCWANTKVWWATNIALTAAVKEELVAQKVTLRGPVREVRQI
ncbi:MAG: mechanosensitive ion channel family protein [Clostridiales bacterium]|nr:mechanosensitive ion channel family protein [Clostridiales bacterium]